jgi:hypothetical protein
MTPPKGGPRLPDWRHTGVSLTTDLRNQVLKAATRIEDDGAMRLGDVRRAIAYAERRMRGR